MQLQLLYSFLTTILLPFTLGLICFFLFNEKRKKNHYLRKNGIQAEGIVFDFSEESNSASGDSLKYPIIRFVTQNNEWITEKYNTTRSTLREGDKFPVYYDNNNPRDFYVDMGAIIEALPILIMIGGIGATGYGLYNLIQYLLS